MIHLVKVAGVLLQPRRIIVLGSSFLLATYQELGQAGNLLEPSFDADLLIEEIDDASARMVDEMIGDESPFRDRFNYYADILRVAITDVLPPGWEQRLIPLTECDGVFCLEPHDLAVAKLRAGRPKDMALLTALAATGRLAAETIRERLDQTSMPEAAIVATYRRLREVNAAATAPPS